MKEQIILTKTAILAMELGFNHSNGNGWYYKSNGTEWWSNYKGGISGKEKTYVKCTQSLLQKWLRDKYFLYVESVPYGDSIHYWPSITDLKNDPNKNIQDRLFYIYYIEKDGLKFNKYEKALEIALYDALKIIQKRK